MPTYNRNSQTINATKGGQTLIDQHMKALLEQAVNKIVTSVFDIIQNDPHQWSNRPCVSCETVSTLSGRRFGCVEFRYRNIEKERRRID